MYDIEEHEDSGISLFFFKQKTAYEMRISDWSSDVCSSDLAIVAERTGYPTEMLGLDADLEADLGIDSIKRVEILGAFQKAMPAAEIGRASCRERGWQYV